MDYHSPVQCALLSRYPTRKLSYCSRYFEPPAQSRACTGSDNEMSGPDTALFFAEAYCVKRLCRHM